MRLTDAERNHLAEMENDIAELWASMPRSNEERLTIIEGEISILKQPKLTPKQNDTINQIRAGYIHLTRKVDEVIAYRKTKGLKDTSYIYSSIKETK